jgi:hypothetical protein
MAKGSKDMIGSQADLKNGPADMQREEFRSGTIDMIGSDAEMHGRTPIGEFDKHTRGGTIDFIGDRMSLSNTPKRGWDSWDTPIAEQTKNPQNK